jgi:single-strand DNA-binding protein
MSGSVNKVILIGNVGKDPEIRSMQNGDRIANLALATSESWRDKASGERKEKTEWHRVSCFNDNISKVIEQYVKKGSKIYVEGVLATRKWIDKDGVEKYTTEVVIQRFNGALTLLPDGRGGSDSPPAVNGTDDYGEAKSYKDAKSGPSFEFDDEIPF